jgi:hypothetical protein
MTTPLETSVTDAVFAAFPAVTTRIDGPLPDGTTWMEIIAGAKWIMVEWHPNLPFGVSRVMGSTGFGEGSGVYPDEDSAIARILELLAA